MIHGNLSQHRESGERQGDGAGKSTTVTWPAPIEYIFTTASFIASIVANFVFGVWIEISYYCLDPCTRFANELHVVSGKIADG